MKWLKRVQDTADAPQESDAALALAQDRAAEAANEYLQHRHEVEAALNESHPSRLIHVIGVLEPQKDGKSGEEAGEGSTVTSDETGVFFPRRYNIPKSFGKLPVEMREKIKETVLQTPEFIHFEFPNDPNGMRCRNINRIFAVLRTCIYHYELYKQCIAGSIKTENEAREAERAALVRHGGYDEDFLRQGFTPERAKELDLFLKRGRGEHMKPFFQVPLLFDKDGNVVLHVCTIPFVPEVALFYLEGYLRHGFVVEAQMLRNNGVLEEDEDVNTLLRWGDRVRSALFPLHEVKERLETHMGFYDEALAHGHRPARVPRIDHAIAWKGLFRRFSEYDSNLEECKILVGSFHPYWLAPCGGNDEKKDRSLDSTLDEIYLDSTLPETHLEEIFPDRSLEDQGFDDKDERDAITYIYDRIRFLRDMVSYGQQRLLGSSDSVQVRRFLDDLAIIRPGPPRHVHADGRPTIDPRRWLRSPCGREFLRSPSSSGWLASQGSRKFLRDPESGHVWLGSDEGRAWLESTAGRDYLQEPEARLFIHSKAGEDWLQTKEGKAWKGTRAIEEPDEELKSRQEGLDYNAGPRFCQDSEYLDVNTGFKITFVRFKKLNPLGKGNGPDDYDYYGYDWKDKGKAPVFTLAQR